MEIPADVIAYTRAHFAPTEWDDAFGFLECAVMHDGKPSDARCLRCALVGSRGELRLLAYYVDLLRIDFRDVIVAGEYEVRDKKLIRVRDLQQPISET